MTKGVENLPESRLRVIDFQEAGVLASTASVATLFGVPAFEMAYFD